MTFETRTIALALVLVLENAFFAVSVRSDIDPSDTDPSGCEVVLCDIPLGDQLPQPARRIPLSLLRALIDHGGAALIECDPSDVGGETTAVLRAGRPSPDLPVRPEQKAVTERFLQMLKAEAAYPAAAFESVPVPA